MDELRQINYIMAETDSAYHEAAVKLGLSDSAMVILYTLYSAGAPVPLRQIPKLTGVSKQTINSALRRLETEGVVYLEAAGGKSKNICLTEAGQALCAQSVARLIRLENEILREWSREELTLWLALNRRYLNQFREKIKEL